MTPSAPVPAPAYEQAAWSWTEHLRAGGRTTWTDWVASGKGADATVPAGWVVPAAAQLELLRRAALRSPDDPRLAGLADLVLARSGPGRGLAQQPLSWVGPREGRRFGAPAVDPSDVPVEELVRVGVGALTELLLRSPARPAAAPTPRRRRFTGTPAFALAGAPVTTSVVRRGLAVAGHVEGGRSPEVVLLAEPFDRTLAQVWSARVQRGAPVRWPGFVRRWSGRPELPPSADLPALARTWAEQVGPARVHVVVAPAGPDPAVRAVAGLLGLDERAGRRRGPAPEPRWKDLSAAAVDVLRRVNAVLNVRAPEPTRGPVVRALVAALSGEPDDLTGPALTVPDPFRSWALDRARAQAEAIRAGGYPVHGDLDRIVPRIEGLPTRPRDSDVLRVVLDACLGHLGTDAHPRRADQR